jgi:hypothetical protein
MKNRLRGREMLQHLIQPTGTVNDAFRHRQPLRIRY